MGNFFSRRHPLIMQALGGLIAVIVMIPVGIYVFQSVFNSPAPETAVRPLAPPPAVTAASSSSTGATGTPTGATGSTTQGITIKMQPVAGKPGQYVFNPANVSIKSGTTVNWVDADPTLHNIVGSNPTAIGFINKTAVDATSYSLTFHKKGVYKYECQVHLPEMVGQITVT